MITNPLSLRSTFVGFDSVFDHLERGLEIEKTQKYPPHNLVVVDENNSVVELAVAGFSEEELDIQLDKSVLTVTGEKKPQERKYVHHGIAFRKFSKQFRLGEYVQIKEASLKDGILSVHLELKVPEDKKPQKIKINA